MNNKKINNMQKYLKAFCFFVLVFSIAFTNSVCSKHEQNLKINPDTTKKSVIQFNKQGEVYFLDKNKNPAKQIDVEIADNDEKRHRGLMFREKMDTGQGMLFIFSDEEPQSFWMANTLIPLDIVFVNSKKQIVKIYKNTRPLDESSLPSYKPSMYVVEVNGGFSNRFNIKEGDYIDFRRF